MNTIVLLLGLLVVPGPAQGPTSAPCAAAGICATKTAGQSNMANTARDGDVATREEFDAAVASGDTERLRLFIARNPDHPLAAKARAELDKLEKK